jgi:hypothetical protein
LSEFRELLSLRAAFRRYQQDRPFYSMYNVGCYTLAPIKVVWRRMDKRINAAVAAGIDDPLLGKRCLIPQETCCLIPADSLDEAHYLCAVLNSTCANFLVSSHSVRGGKGFGTPSMLDYLPIRRFEPSNDLHRRLSRLSATAHGGEANMEEEIDSICGRLWSISPAEMDLMARTD